MDNPEMVELRTAGLKRRRPVEELHRQVLPDGCRGGSGLVRAAEAIGRALWFGLTTSEPWELRPLASETVARAAAPSNNAELQNRIEAFNRAVAGAQAAEILLQRRLSCQQRDAAFHRPSYSDAIPDDPHQVLRDRV